MDSISSNGKIGRIQREGGYGRPDCVGDCRSPAGDIVPRFFSAVFLRRSLGDFRSRKMGVWFKLVSCSIRLLFLVFGHDSGLDRRLRRSDRRLLQNGHNSRPRVGIILGMLPGVATGCRIGIDQFKYFHEAIPDNFATKLLLNANRIAVIGFAVMQSFNRLFEQFNVVHSPILSPTQQ